MKFSSHLTEAILLKRIFRFMAEIVLSNRQKLVIRCPNMGDMRGCDILGTKIWYSNPMGYNCLPSWELAESDGGFLVCVNPELMKPLVIDAIKQNFIAELSGYTILHAGGHYDQFRSQFMLLEKDQQQCYVAIEQVIVAGENSSGVFPASLGDGIDNLHALIQARDAGHEAILLYCIMHTGIDKITPISDIDPEYSKMLQQAEERGVQILAYRVSVNLEEITLDTPISVSLSAILL